MEWCDEDTWAEWVDGEVIVLAPASERHQALRGFLEAVMTIYVEQRRLGRVLGAPFQMKTGPELPGRDPDIFFIAREHADRIGEQVFGVPDLIVEVTSPSTARLDRLEKFYEYARAGVREYWIVDPDGRTVEVYGLEGGAYVLRGKWGPGETASSGLLAGFEVKVDDVVGGS